MYQRYFRRPSKRTARASRFVVLLLTATSAACGINGPSEYVIRVDDIVVDSASQQIDSVTVRFTVVAAPSGLSQV